MRRPITLPTSSPPTAEVDVLLLIEDAKRAADRSRRTGLVRRCAFGAVSLRSRRGPGTARRASMNDVGTRGSLEELDALQARVDQIAGELFSSPAWTSPVPDVRVDQRVPRINRALVSSRNGRGLIRISPAAAEEPVEILRGTLSHEAGHLALGHQPAAHTGWALAVGVPLWSLAIACCAIGVQHSSTQQTSIWFAAAFLPALLALRLIVIPSRRCELAADQWSATLIGADAVLRTLRHIDRRCGPFARFTATIGMDTHPSPRQRARRLRRA